MLTHSLFIIYKSIIVIIASNIFYEQKRTLSLFIINKNISDKLLLYGVISYCLRMREESHFITLRTRSKNIKTRFGEEF